MGFCWASFRGKGLRCWDEEVFGLASGGSGAGGKGERGRGKRLVGDGFFVDYLRGLYGFYMMISRMCI